MPLLLSIASLDPLVKVTSLDLLLRSTSLDPTVRSTSLDPLVRTTSLTRSILPLPQSSALIVEPLMSLNICCAWMGVSCVAALGTATPTVCKLLCSLK